MSHVYFIQSGHESIFKIGVSKNAPEKRLAQLQTGSPRPLSVYASMETDNPYELEAALHQTFGDRKLKGEWFSLSREEVDEFVRGSRKPTPPYVGVFHGKYEYLYNTKTDECLFCPESLKGVMSNYFIYSALVDAKTTLDGVAWLPIDYLSQEFPEEDHLIKTLEISIRSQAHIFLEGLK